MFASVSEKRGLQVSLSKNQGEICVFNLKQVNQDSAETDASTVTRARRILVRTAACVHRLE